MVPETNLEKITELRESKVRLCQSRGRWYSLCISVATPCNRVCPPTVTEKKMARLNGVKMIENSIK